MSGMEFNKIMAAFLVAGIVAALSGFISRETVHAHALHADAVPVEVVDNDNIVDAAASKKASGPEPILALLADADIARGEKVAKACAACHTFDKGGKDGVGPNLWNVMSRGRAARDGFSYSKGMKEMGGEWTYDDLNHFLWKPKKFISDTKMSFAGTKKTADRAALIAWMRTKSDNPPALPSADDAAAAAEGAAEDVMEAVEGAAESAADAVTEH